MAKLGVEPSATRGRAGKSVAQPERPETPLADKESRAGGAPATTPAASPATARGGYRRVFACAIASSDSPDEERNP